MIDEEITDGSREDDFRMLYSVALDRVAPNEDFDTYVDDESVEVHFLILVIITFVFSILIIGLESVFYLVIRAFSL
ncbi:hypothetical protein [Haladaptatus sp. CMAA 1911]|uniref:hypothetical protein n=1 Tax=unclassified Haladaptatus TaxID=2622732 RepID=UPI003754BBF9